MHMPVLCIKPQTPSLLIRKCKRKTYMTSNSMPPFYLYIILVFLMPLCFGVFFLIKKLFHWCYLVKSNTQHENWIKRVSNQTHSPLFAATSQDDCRKQFRLCVK